jgi:site-specific recombinase XerD
VDQAAQSNKNVERQPRINKHLERLRQGLDVQQRDIKSVLTAGQQRTMYNLRHTYATNELMAGTEIHTLARQMGTSVVMLEKHYSKLTATMAAEQLA